MRAKPLLADDDFVMNPSGYFGDKIPRFYPVEGQYAMERGHFNYGVFRSTEYANRKASPILEAIVSLYFGENEEERTSASDTLRQIAENYKQLK